MTASFRNLHPTACDLFNRVVAAGTKLRGCGGHRNHQRRAAPLIVEAVQDSFAQPSAKRPTGVWVMSKLSKHEQTVERDLVIHAHPKPMPGRIGMFAAVNLNAVVAISIDHAAAWASTLPQWICAIKQRFAGLAEVTPAAA